MDKGYDTVGKIKNSLLSNNPMLIHGLGISPAVIVCTDAKTAVGIGVMTLIAVMLSGVIVSLLRVAISGRVRIILFASVSAGIALLEESAAKAFTPSLYDKLGVLFPFVAFNSFVILFVHSVAMHKRPLNTFLDAFFDGMGFALAILAAASVRELLSKGTVFGAVILGDGYKGSYFFSHPAGVMMIFGVVAAIFKALGNIKNKTQTQKKLIQMTLMLILQKAQKKLKIVLLKN